MGRIEEKTTHYFSGWFVLTMTFIDLLQAHGWGVYPFIHGVHEAILATASNGTTKSLKCAAVPLGNRCRTWHFSKGEFRIVRN